MKRSLILLTGLSLLLSACSKLTADNYAKIKTGMSSQEVQTLIGRPDRCDDLVGLKTCVWGDDSRNISINFVADRVVLSSAHNIR